MNELSRFEIPGRGTVIVVDKIANPQILLGGVVDIGGVYYTVLGYESCLIPGHDDGTVVCTCFKGTALLVKEGDE